MLTVIYNDDCSKCAGVSAILDQSGRPWTPIRYLTGELTLEILDAVFDSYDGPWNDLIRQNELEWQNAQVTGGDIAALKAFIFEYPVVLQRPLVLEDGKLIIARPPEVLWTILSNEQSKNQ